MGVIVQLVHQERLGPFQLVDPFGEELRREEAHQRTGQYNTKVHSTGSPPTLLTTQMPLFYRPCHNSLRPPPLPSPRGILAADASAQGACKGNQMARDIPSFLTSRVPFNDFPEYPFFPYIVTHPMQGHAFNCANVSCRQKRATKCGSRSRCNATSTDPNWCT